MVEPNKERIKLWVEALRSGKYKQAKGRLRQGENSYCCLGVACEISNLGMWIPVEGNKDDEEYEQPGEWLYEVDEDDVSQVHLPTAVYKHYGLSTSMPTTQDKEIEQFLTRINDSGKDFLYIAAQIEKEYLA